MIRIKVMQESLCPDLLCAMLNFVFPSGSFSSSKGSNLYVHEDQLLTIVDDGAMRYKYLEVIKLHSALLEMQVQ